jgi:hypothetical protein
VNRLCAGGRKAVSKNQKKPLSNANFQRTLENLRPSLGFLQQFQYVTDESSKMATAW